MAGYLFLRDRWKEQAHDDITSLRKIIDCTINPLILKRSIPVHSLRALATSLVRLGRDHAV